MRDFQVGDKVAITFKQWGYKGVIVCKYPYGDKWVVATDTRVSLASGDFIGDLVVAGIFLRLLNNYSDEVRFDYRKPDGEFSTRHVLVTRETPSFIEGHDVEKDGFRRFSIDRIQGKIFRAGKPE